METTRWTTTTKKKVVKATVGTITASDTGDSRADHFDNRTRLQHLQKGIQLGTVTGQLHRVGTVGDIDYPATEDVSQALQFFTSLAFRMQLDQQHLALDMRAIGHVHQFHDINQLVQLFGNLLDDLLGTARDQRHARQGGILGGRHSQ